MSRFDELLAEHCPDGVPFVRLGDVATTARGQSLTKAQTTAGPVPVLAGGRSPAYYHDKSNRSGETIVVAGSGAYAGFVSWWDQPIWVSDAFSVVSSSDALLNRYCYHFLLSQQEAIHQFKSGGGVPHVYPKQVAELRMPVPPVAIQSEIVRILDTFTSLEAELEAELEARREQYKYHRHALLQESASSSGAALERLGDVCTFNRGKWIKATSLLPGRIPVITSSRSVSAYHNASNRTGTTVVVASSGAYAGYVSIWREPVYLSNAFSVDVKDVASLDPEFLFLCLQDKQGLIHGLAAGAGVPNIYGSDIADIQIPVPPLTDQVRIVHALNAFRALVDDLSGGLPAEIAARRKQFEHYRERLLTFKELEA